jgi:hypothetical protein
MSRRPSSGGRPLRRGRLGGNGTARSPLLWSSPTWDCPVVPIRWLGSSTPWIIVVCPGRYERHEKNEIIPRRIDSAGIFSFFSLFRRPIAERERSSFSIRLQTATRCRSDLAKRMIASMLFRLATRLAWSTTSPGGRPNSPKRGGAMIPEVLLGLLGHPDRRMYRRNRPPDSPAAPIGWKPSSGRRTPRRGSQASQNSRTPKRGWCCDDSVALVVSAWRSHCLPARIPHPRINAVQPGVRKKRKKRNNPPSGRSAGE